jgi:undecaprenyl diphosphate synthase
MPPDASKLPQHLAIIMDGNRRWAKQRGLPATVGHVNGAMRVRHMVQACKDRGIRFLTLFAFSTENWRRPQSEVSGLMNLLRIYLHREAKNMREQGVRLRTIGDTSKLHPKLQALISRTEAATAHCDTLTLCIAVNYSGRWDVIQALQAWQRAHPGTFAQSLRETDLTPYFSTAFAPDPDLLIRTGGELRISNFMLWQTAYTELYFSGGLWPDFSEAELDRALNAFAVRDRRFGADTQQALVASA